MTLATAGLEARRARRSGYASPSPIPLAGLATAHWAFEARLRERSGLRGWVHFASAGSATKLSRRRPAGVPALIELGQLLQITECILRDEKTDEDLRHIFAPGSPLDGGWPKASVIDQHGNLSIAKFSKETDD